MVCEGGISSASPVEDNQIGRSFLNGRENLQQAGNIVNRLAMTNQEEAH